MKVVLFCGGMGMRLRDHSQTTPKPLALIRNRPILWHLMSYYAHYGHKDFILCLGYGANEFKEYFLNYNETVSNDFVLTDGGRSVELLSSDIHDWTIRFVDTGLHSNIGMRLCAVREHIASEEMFLANYSDGLSDLPLDDYIKRFSDTDMAACFASVRTSAVFHMVESEQSGVVTSIQTTAEADLRINGGFFAFRQSVFDYIEEGEELVLEPFKRMAADRKLMAQRYDGFWQCLDTFKDKQKFDELSEREVAPWEVWKLGKGGQGGA